MSWWPRSSGATPEVIHENYEPVSLADVYAIFAYYLRHRGEVEDYLAEQERLGAELQARIEAIDRPTACAPNCSRDWTSDDPVRHRRTHRAGVDRRASARVRGDRHRRVQDVG